MKIRLANAYKSYLDKGGISVKNDKLKNAVNAGIKQLRAYSQTASELKLTAKELYEIADCALRLSTEEELVHSQKQRESHEEILIEKPQSIQMLDY